MKKIILIAAILLVVFAFRLIDTKGMPKKKAAIDNQTEKRLAEHVKAVKAVISNNPKYNNEIGFFVDMKIPSGRNRFFVFDFKQNKVIDEGLVAHGSGSETGVEGQLKFSNVNKSLATSLGKYYIDISYYGQFGKAYKLYGLDKTNSNAYNRNIVLHKYSKVPYEEQLESICNSYGCPMVNEKYFKRIENIIDNSKKNIILEIYY